MNANFHSKPVIPATVKDLDADVVVEVLSRHSINVSDAASELGVASADLRKLLWARPALADAAAEMEERRLDLAERNILEALNSDDPRTRVAASMFTIRNSARSRRRGWITSAAPASLDEVERAQAEGHEVVTFSWRDPNDPDDGDGAAEMVGRFPVPRYGGEPTLEPEPASACAPEPAPELASASAPEPVTPALPVWPGPHPPPPQVADQYQPFVARPRGRPRKTA